MDPYSFPPEYSVTPRFGESRLEHSPSRRQRLPTDTWLITVGNVTVALSGQEKDAEIPRYGRRGRVEGAMLLDNREVVASVTIKLLGRTILSNSEIGSRTVNTVELVQLLWASTQNTGTTSVDICPGAIPFSLRFPEMCQDDESGEPNLFALPPTFNGEHLGFASQYVLVIEVVDRRRPALGFISRNSVVSIPLNYEPRTRPSQPLLHRPLFLSSVKASPEEWRQNLTTVRIRDNEAGKVGAINCNLFVPSIQTFSVTDAIPFHVQLTAPLKSLQLFFPSGALPQSLHPSAPSPSYSSVPPSPFPSNSPSSISVYLLRQVIVELNNRTFTRSTVIGSGSLRAVPPPLSRSPPRREDHMDWEGEVRCNSDVKAGGFVAAGVTVRDYIVADLQPPADSPFLPSKNGVGIVIVTDPWTDDAA
ncbi:hypothetical protein BDZ89DRAFT_1199214 [Hymenopellis radicata]|nr:hypothetical protein BDZ89DRAFT_1199214 [Hymenopellis radicata]